MMRPVARCARYLAQLHPPRGNAGARRKPRDPPSSALMPLTKWFGPTAEIHGGILRVAAETAADLLATQHDVVVLHGDVHHENVLGFGSRGWLAIDPKALVGER
jgi:streptomycin 6-kinase